MHWSSIFFINLWIFSRRKKMSEPAAIKDRIDRPTPAWMSCKDHCYHWSWWRWCRCPLTENYLYDHIQDCDSYLEASPDGGEWVDGEKSRGRKGQKGVWPAGHCDHCDHHPKSWSSWSSFSSPWWIRWGEGLHCDQPHQQAQANLKYCF